MSRQQVKMILVPSLVLLGFGILFISVGMKELGMGILIFEGVCLAAMLTFKIFKR
jgi:hypothetical protein